MIGFRTGKYKIKLFDTLLVASLTIVLLSFFILLTRTTKDLVVTIKVGQDNVKDLANERGVGEWYSSALFLNLKDQSYFDTSTANIINIKQYDADPGKKNIYVTVNLKTIYNTALKRYTYNGKNVLIGSPIDINFDRLYLYGVIVDIEGYRPNDKMVNLIVKSQFINNQANFKFQDTGGVPPFVADGLQEGDIIKDFHGGSVVELIKKDIENAKRVVVTSDGNVLLREDPYLKDIFLTFKIRAVKRENRYYFFEDLPILINYPLPIHFDKTSIWPLVTAIDEIK